MTGAGPDPKSVTQCRSCGADIVFLRTETGKRMPVNVLPTAQPFRGPNAGELYYKRNAHQSHFATCPAASEFRSKNR